MVCEYEGKHYLVVGASSGIGESVALELASLGANVTMLARRLEKMEAIRERMVSGRHELCAFDVSNLSRIDEMVNTVNSRYGSIDGCVYCAGSGDTARLRDLTPARLHNVMQVNFYAFVEFVRCLVEQKAKKQSMRIVALSSLASVCNNKYFTPYAASKAAMDAAVRCLARELVSKKVTLNSIRPAVVDVERLRDLDDLTGGINEQIKKSGYQPLGMIPPEDIAKMVSYLLSDAASYITGTTLPFNGGAAC